MTDQQGGDRVARTTGEEFILARTNKKTEE